MRRREFITVVAGAAASPLAARGQQQALPVIGILDNAGNKWADAFRQGLSEGNIIEGRDVSIDHRSTEKYGEVPALAAELVRRRVAVIAALGGVSAKEAKAATASIPIVFTVGGDPVELGLVASLNNPGGNMTGVTFFAARLVQKQAGVLHDLVPKATLLGILINPNNPRHPTDAADLQVAARTLGLDVHVVKAGSERDLDAGFAGLMERNARALVIAGDAFFFFQRDQIVALAAHHAIPTIYSTREYVVAGGLMSYAASLKDSHRQAGIYAARIVKGEKPGDLLVMQPSKFELVINLKTAKVLGLDIPPTLIALADEVIE